MRLSFLTQSKCMEKEVSVHEFEQAIKQTHGCLSALHSRKFLHENVQGQPVWHGEVLTFDLLNHPTAQRCYAWAVEGRVTAVLHEGPVDSPQAAVRETLATEHPTGPTDP